MIMMIILINLGEPMTNVNGLTVKHIMKRRGKKCDNTTGNLCQFSYKFYKLWWWRDTVFVKLGFQTEAWLFGAQHSRRLVVHF